MSLLQLFPCQFATAHLRSSQFRLPSLSPMALVTKSGYKEKHVAIVVDPVLSMATSFDAVEQYMCVSQTRRLSRQSAPYFYHWATSLHDTPKAIKQRSRSFAPL
jgi:hypothetical protein